MKGFLKQGTRKPETIRMLELGEEYQHIEVSLMESYNAHNFSEYPVQESWHLW